MTQLTTTLTPRQVHAVLHGLADQHPDSDGTARTEAITAMADALTTTTPVDPNLERLRFQLADALCDSASAPYDGDRGLVEAVCKLRASLRSQADVHRDTLTELLDLHPSISDEDLAEAVTEAIALRRAAAVETAARPAGRDPAWPAPNAGELWDRLLGALGWQRVPDEMLASTVERALTEVTRLATNHRGRALEARR